MDGGHLGVDRKGHAVMSCQPFEREKKKRSVFWWIIIRSCVNNSLFLAMWFWFGANTTDKQSLFQSGWFVVGLLTQTLIAHMIRTEKIPFLQSTASPMVLLLVTAIMAVGLYLPFSPQAAALKLQPLPGQYFIFLALVLAACRLPIQFFKRFYIRRFKSWL